MTSIPWLTVLWAVPMVGAALVLLLPAATTTVVPRETAPLIAVW